jgi:TRAP-type uncharacterized transport system substrate-binding protein
MRRASILFLAVAVVAAIGAASTAQEAGTQGARTHEAKPQEINTHERTRASRSRTEIVGGEHHRRVATRERPRPRSDDEIRSRTNVGTVNLAAGLIEGAPLRFAAEISRVVNGEGEAHVLPVVTRGPTENVNDLLYLKGIDVAIINSDSLDEYKAQVPQVEHRIVHIMNLFPSELHVFVRPGISSLAELAGKKVNFNTQGTAAAYSGPLIFSRLGIDVDRKFVPHPLALELLRKGEMDAVVFVTSKPVDAFVKGRWEQGFGFLPVEFTPRLSDYYVPAKLSSADYPTLIPAGREIPTVAVPTVLVAYNWQPGSPRYGRVARFVDILFGRLDRLRTPGFDPKWQDADPTASVPGLHRMKAAQDWLDGHRLAQGGPRQ